MVYFFFLGVQRKRSLENSFKRFYSRGMVLVYTNVFCGNPLWLEPVCLGLCLSVCLSVCLFVCRSVSLSVSLSVCLFGSLSFCLTLIDQKWHRYINPVNKSNLKPNGYSWSVAYEKVYERARHDSSLIG